MIFTFENSFFPLLCSPYAQNKLWRSYTSRVAGEEKAEQTNTEQIKSKAGQESRSRQVHRTETVQRRWSRLACCPP
jgi:hypothetical protein